MRVLHVLDHSLPLQSGYASRSVSIFRAQRSLGWDTAHLTSTKQGQVGGLEEEVGGWTFFRMPPQGRTAALLGEIAAMRTMARRLDQLVERLKPDVLHAHSPLLNGYPALWVARRRGLPVAYEIRAFWEDAAVDHGTTRENSLRYRTTRALETRLCAAVDRVLPICHGLHADIVARGISETKVKIAPNIIETAAFTGERLVDEDLRRRLGLDGSTVLGFIGSFYAYEGLPMLVEVVPQLLRRDPTIKLLLVGGGPDEPRIAQRVAELGLSRHVVSTGRVPLGEVRRYYDLVDLFVYPRLPMRLTDLVTPLKPIEAMASSRLVVASDVGGHRELVEDGITGFLFRAGDPNDLVRVIDGALTDRSRWPALARAARRSVEQQRDITRLAEVYEQALGSLVRT
jgi:PEP-CTERM/exosortase A-associated glycosyltransferase